MIALDNTTLMLDGQFYFAVKDPRQERRASRKREDERAKGKVKRTERNKDKERKEEGKWLDRLEWQPTPEVADNVVKS